MRERFRREYEPHALAIQMSFANVRFKSNAGVDGKLARIEYLWAFDERTRVGIDRITDIRNARYFATIRQRPNGDRLVQRLDFAGPGRRLLLCRLSFPYADTMIAQETYLELIHDGSARFVSFDDCKFQGRPMKLLRVDYTTKNTDGKPHVFNMRYYFCPIEQWLCRRVEYSDDSRAGARDCSYETKQGESFPSVRRLQDRFENRHGSKVSISQWTLEIDEFTRLSQLPQRDFTLSAFGLPEPNIKSLLAGAAHNLGCSASVESGRMLRSG